jgi:hypothetical protein
MDKVIEIIKNRILVAEKKKGEYDTLEMDAFWDGQLRCAQYLLNEVSRLTKRAPDLWDSAPLQSLSTPEADTPAGHLSTPPTSG